VDRDRKPQRIKSDLRQYKLQVRCNTLPHQLTKLGREELIKTKATMGDIGGIDAVGLTIPS
jgi:hypothetical protein